MSAVSALALFAPGASEPLGQRVATALGIALAPFELRRFEDGEQKGRPLASVRGLDCFLLATLHAQAGRSVNDALVETLFAAGALRDAGAARVALVAPYLCYARKDARTQPRDPVNSRQVAQLCEAMGIGLVLACEVHSRAAFDNAFRVTTVHLEATSLFVAALHGLLPAGPVCVVSPDAGGLKRAERLRHALEIALERPVGRALMEKRRSAGQVTGDYLAGEVAGHAVVIVDDLISGGTTLARTVEACLAHGATRILAAATHGVFSPAVAARLVGLPLEQLLLTDTAGRVAVPGTVGDGACKLSYLDCAPLLATAIAHLHAERGAD